MKRLWRQLRALFLLGLQALLLQPIRRLKKRGRSGESRFLEAYSPDRLLPLTAEERERRDRFGGCIHCGLCDAHCEVLGRVRRSTLPSLSAVASAYGRSMSEYPFAKHALEDLSSCSDCNGCESVCPMGVPLREMIEDLRAHVGRLEEAGIVLTCSGSRPPIRDEGEMEEAS
ncbi:MAG: 4Fe-4S dicluster domain-containing protein, partial [Myxococcota bacterium]